MTNEELELIKNAKNGDQDAINKIFFDKNTLVLQISKKYFMNGCDLDDIVQEGRFGLYKAIMNYDENKNDNFSNYASVVIKREILSAIRNANADKNKMLDESIFVGEDDEELLQSENTPEDDIMLAERFKEIKEKMFSSLSDLERQVFDYYLQEYSYIDIANILDKSPKTIDNALTRIKLKLTTIKEKL